MKVYGVREWTVIYAAWCIKYADLSANDAFTCADEAWIECGPKEDPEVMAESDMAA